MKYTVKRIDEDIDFGCEERSADAPVMAVVTLIDEAGQEVKCASRIRCSMIGISMRVTR